MDSKQERHLRNLLDRHFHESGVYELLDVDAGIDVDAFLATLSEAPLPHPDSTSDAHRGSCLEVSVGRLTSVLGPTGGTVSCSLLLGHDRQTTPAVPLRGEAADLEGQQLFFSLAPAGGPLVKRRLPLHVLLVHADAHGMRSVLCESEVEWRHVLSQGRATLNLELQSPGVPVPGGLLEVSLRYHSSDAFLHSASEVTQYLAAERETLNSHQLLFAQYARSWEAAPTAGAPRPPMRISFEWQGRELPLSAFIDAIEPHPSLPTPLHAAHYVALFRHNDTPTPDVMGNAAGSAWSALHNVLATGACSARERCCLLCALLLGYGLDAYVGYARSVSGEQRFYVLTREEPACVWDALTGMRQPLAEAADISRVELVFNAEAVFQFVHANPAVSLSLDVTDLDAWRAADAAHATKLPRLPVPRLQLRHAESSEVLDRHLEQKLCFALAEYRSAMGLHGRVLCGGEVYSVLGQGLWQRERESLCGRSIGCDSLLRDACSFSLPRRYTLTALPRHYAYDNESLIAAHLLSHAQTRCIVETQKHNAFVVLRCRMALYPEGLKSVWLMLASVHTTDTAGVSALAAAATER